jgi:hypothetical protein
MNDTSLPPIPGPGATGPQVCETVRLYLAVMNDLTPEQVALLSRHVAKCPGCAAEFRRLNQTTQLVASGLAPSAPSPRVDRAVMAALTAQNGGQAAKPVRKTPRRSPVGASAERSGARFNSSRPAPQRSEAKRVSILRPRPAWLVRSLATAAVIAVALLGAMLLNGVSPVATGPQKFSLPKNLSWDGYVLYHSEIGMGSSGKPYHVYTYHNLGEEMMHVETMIDGSLDVVSMENEKNGETLGMDMMHHVAQWGADEWMVDDSVFDLAQLRHDLDTNNDIYLDKDTFKGQPVYEIRLKNGLVLLLDMHYQPVNVLQGMVGTGTGQPMYDSLKMMPSSQVPEDMWNMSVPPGFHMGKLPPKP